MQNEDGPVRVQLRRTKGWRLPPNTMSVARPGRWGNPFIIGGINGFRTDYPGEPDVWVTTNNIAEAVENFRWLVNQGDRPARIRKALAGKNLACWCPLGQPCHADVLLELANSPTPGGHHDQ